MKRIKIAVIQLNSQPDLKLNMQNIYHQIKKAESKGADLICLPENFAFMGNEKERLHQKEEICQVVEEKLSLWAKELGVFILGGGYPVPAEHGKVFNRSALFNPSGELQVYYDKIHLFDVDLDDGEVYRESDMVQPGEKIVVAKLNDFGIKMGFSICYDVRFPELFRQQAKSGAQVLTVPAAFTKPTGQAHWHTLLKARAIENSCYVIAPAQTGKHGNVRQTFGHSIIINPWGEILDDTSSDGDMAIAEIDLQEVESIRKKLPSLRHRRLF